MRVLDSDDDMAEYSDFGGRRARRQALIDLLEAILRLAPPKKSMQESDLNSFQAPLTDTDQL
jgi:hypothetical protein